MAQSQKQSSLMGICKSDDVLSLNITQDGYFNILQKDGDKQEYEAFRVIFEQYSNIEEIHIRSIKFEEEEKYLFFKDSGRSICILLDEDNKENSITACLNGIDRKLVATNRINKEKEKINDIRQKSKETLDDEQKKYLAHIVKDIKIERQNNEYLNNADVNNWYVNFEKKDNNEIDGISEKLEILQQICANGEKSSTEGESKKQSQGEENIVVNELLQNVYDHIDTNNKVQEKALNIIHDTNDNFISLSYPERGFSVLDFYAICTVGNSGNVAAGRGGETEGHKGTGFKSVYQYFYKVEIESRGVGCVLNCNQYWKVDVNNSDPTKFSIEKKDSEEGGGEKFSNPIPEFDLVNKKDDGLTVIKLHYNAKDNNKVKDKVSDLLEKFKDKSRYLFLMDKIKCVKVNEDTIIDSQYIDDNFYVGEMEFDVNAQIGEQNVNDYKDKDIRFLGQKKTITMLFPKELKVSGQDVSINGNQKCFGEFANFNEVESEPYKYVYCTLPIETGTPLALPFYVNIPLFELTDSRTNLFSNDKNQKTEWNNLIKRICCKDEIDDTGQLKKAILREIYEDCMECNSKEIAKPYQYLPVILEDNIISKDCFLSADVFDYVDNNNSKTCFNELDAFLLPKYVYKYISMQEGNDCYLNYLEDKEKEKKYIKEYRGDNKEAVLYKILPIDSNDFKFTKKFFLEQFISCLVEDEENSTKLEYLKWLNEKKNLLCKDNNKVLNFIFQLYLGSSTNIYDFPNTYDLSNTYDLPNTYETFELFMKTYKYKQNDQEITGFYNLRSVMHQYSRSFEISNGEPDLINKDNADALNSGLEEYLYTDEGFLEDSDKEDKAYNYKKNFLYDQETINYFKKKINRLDIWIRYCLGKTICENSTNIFDFNVHSEEVYKEAYLSAMHDGNFVPLSYYENKIDEIIRNANQDNKSKFSCKDVITKLRKELYLKDEGFVEDNFIKKTFEYINDLKEVEKKKNALKGVYNEELLKNGSILSLLKKGLASYKYATESNGDQYRILENENEILYYNANDNNNQAICNANVINGVSFNVDLSSYGFIEALQNALCREEFYPRTEACEIFKASYSVIATTEEIIGKISEAILKFLKNDSKTDNKTGLLSILNEKNIAITPAWNDSYKEFLKEYNRNLSSEGACPDKNGELNEVKISFNKNLIFQFDSLSTAEDLIENVRDRADQATMDSYKVTMEQGNEKVVEVTGLESFIKDYVKIYKKSELSEYKYCFGKDGEGKSIIVLFNENSMKSMLENLCKIDVSKLEPDECTYYESTVSHEDLNRFEKDDVEINIDIEGKPQINISRQTISIDDKKYNIEQEKLKKKLCQAFVIMNKETKQRYYFRGYGSDKCPICKGNVLSKASSLHIKKIKVGDVRIPMLMCSNCSEAFRYARNIDMEIREGQSVEYGSSEKLEEYILNPQNKELYIKFSIVGCEDEQLLKVEKVSLLHRLIIWKKIKDIEDANNYTNYTNSIGVIHS